jgi:tight adherence protein B
MQSEDFVWVTQAIAINREVGGNLADVLDGVSDTIRERNQIRRQVKALAAEGKLSAVVLMLLPFGISGFLMMSNPGYMAKFTESFAGYAMIVAAVVLLVVGGLWLRKTVQVKF